MEQDQWVQAPAPAERASRVDVAVRAAAARVAGAARVAADVGLAAALAPYAQ